MRMQADPKSQEVVWIEVSNTHFCVFGCAVLAYMGKYDSSMTVSNHVPSCHGAGVVISRFKEHLRDLFEKGRISETVKPSQQVEAHLAAYMFANLTQTWKWAEIAKKGINNYDLNNIDQNICQRYSAFFGEHLYLDGRDLSQRMDRLREIEKTMEEKKKEKKTAEGGC